jgi:hypothetical protein
MRGSWTSFVTRPVPIAPRSKPRLRMPLLPEHRLDGADCVPSGELPIDAEPDESLGMVMSKDDRPFGS